MIYNHLISNIPPNSYVKVFARGAFCNFKEPTRGNALVLLATPNAYPIKVSITPVIGATHEKGLFNVRVPTNGSCVTSYTQTGTECTFFIKDVWEYNPSGEERYFKDMPGHAWVEVKQANAPRSEKTDIFQRLLCNKCQADIPDGILCKVCDVKRTSCDEATGDGWPPVRCAAPLHQGYGMCKRHALKAGLIRKRSKATVRRPKGRPKKQRPVEVPDADAAAN